MINNYGSKDKKSSILVSLGFDKNQFDQVNNNFSDKYFLHKNSSYYLVEMYHSHPGFHGGFGYANPSENGANGGLIGDAAVFQQRWKSNNGLKAFVYARQGKVQYNTNGAISSTRLYWKSDRTRLTPQDMKWKKVF